MDVIQQLPTLIGVVLGAVTSFATTAAIERSRWSRGQRVRWDERRMGAYADYGNSVKKVINLSCRVLAGQGYPANAEPLPQQEGVAQIAAAELERASRWETVLLLGSAEVIEAGRAWHQEGWTLQWMARGRSESADSFKQTYIRADDARFNFYRAARADIGIKGAMPEVKWGEHGVLKPSDRPMPGELSNPKGDGSSKPALRRGRAAD